MGPSGKYMDKDKIKKKENIDLKSREKDNKQENKDISRDNKQGNKNRNRNNKNWGKDTFLSFFQRRCFKSFNVH